MHLTITVFSLRNRSEKVTQPQPLWDVFSRRWHLMRELTAGRGANKCPHCVCDKAAQQTNACVLFVYYSNSLFLHAVFGDSLPLAKRTIHPNFNDAQLFTKSTQRAAGGGASLPRAGSSAAFGERRLAVSASACDRLQLHLIAVCTSGRESEGLLITEQMH